MDNYLKRITIFFLYCTGIIMMYPIVVYYLKSFRLINFLPLLPKHIFVQVFLSSPILILVGLLLYFKFKNKIFGVLFFVIGILWLIGILYEFFSKKGL